MRLTELLKAENIKLNLAARTKSDAIGELVQILAANREIPDAAKVLAAVLEREAQRTTGIGAGLGIPHGKCAGLDHLAMALGKCVTPVEFGSIDGRPVTWIWLLTSPPDQAGPHIHALAHISKLMSMDKFRRELSAAQTPQQVCDLIKAQEATL